MSEVKQGDVEVSVEKTKDTFEAQPKKMTKKRKRRTPQEMAAARQKDEAPTFIDPVEANKRLIEEQRIKESKIVRGKFTFHEIPGGSISFPFRKFPKDKIARYTFVDGGVYEIPLAVAKHLNTSGSYPVHAHQQNKDGLKVVTVGKNVHRYSFHNNDFIDTSDSDSLATMGRSQVEII